MSLTSRICDLLLANPSWPSTRLGREVGCKSAYVRSVVKRKGLKLRQYIKLTAEQRAEIAKSEDKPRFIKARYGISSSYIWRLRAGPLGPTPKLIVERDARYAALAKRSLTAQLMGDPPPRT